MNATNAGLQSDVKSLNDTILKLQNPGAVNPEGQALIATLQALGKSIAAKLDADGHGHSHNPSVPPVV